MKLINGETIEEMKKLPDASVDCIICDLPYGTTACAWDTVIPFDDLWREYYRLLKDNGNIVLFSAGLFTIDLIQSNRKDFKYKLIWEKNVPTGMASAKYRPMKYYEEICIFQKGSNCTYNPIMKPRVGKGKSCYRYDHYAGKSNHINVDKVKKRYDPDYVQPGDVLQFNVVPNRIGKVHPTQKPVELMNWLVTTYSNEGDTVLDNTMGSGTTGVACKLLNRHFIGIELDKNYYNTAVVKINDVQPPLFMI